MKTPRRIVWLGSVILVVTAIFHGTGHADVTQAVASSDLEGMLSGAIGGLWLFPTIHWLFLALLAVAVAVVRSTSHTCRSRPHCRRSWHRHRASPDLRRPVSR